MHEFKYEDHSLYCEGVVVSDLVKEYPTPFYLYSYKTVLDHFLKITGKSKQPIR